MEDNKALDELIVEVKNAETALAAREAELAERNAEAASIFKAQKELTANVEAIKLLIKEQMRAENMDEWENDNAKLTLKPSGKYRLAEDTDIDDITDDVCEVKKTLVNSKVKAYQELHGKLPEGIESSGDVLRIKWKENKQCQ